MVVFNGNRNHEDDDPKKQKIRVSANLINHKKHGLPATFTHETKQKCTQNMSNASKDNNVKCNRNHHIKAYDRNK